MILNGCIYFHAGSSRSSSSGHYCWRELPGVPIDLSFLQTLRLKGLHDSERRIQRPILSFPHLSNLTLEALFKLKRVSVFDKHLRWFAVHCCYNMRYVHIDVSELRSLDYKGRLPKDPLLYLHGSLSIILCAPSNSIELH